MILGPYCEETSIVLCPNCGSDNLHHTKIEVFNRVTEDSPIGIHAKIEGPAFKIDGDMVGNPSWRRDGLRITLWCEICDKNSTITIFQHKGSTFVEQKKSIIVPDKDNQTIEECLASAYRAWERFNKRGIV
jgi:hypothetical protein